MYSLGTGDRFVKTVTTMSNHGSAALENVRLWLGTRDDYIAITDQNYKTKGNITASGFEPITDQNQQAKTILISQFDPIHDGVTGSAIVFHSTNTDADTVTDQCCSFSNIFNKDPRASAIVTPGEDGSYGLFMNYGTLAAGASRPVVWYYGVAPLSEVNSLVTQITNAGGLEPDLFLTQNAPTVSPVLQNVVSDAVRSSIPTPNSTTTVAMASVSVQRQSNVVNVPAGIDVQFGGGEPLLLVSSLDGDVPNSPVTLAQAQLMLGADTTSANPGGESSGNDAGNGDRVVKVPASRNSLVQIVNGGVRLPNGVEQQLFVVKK